MSNNNNNFNLDWIAGYDVESLYFPNTFFKIGGKIDPRAKALKKTIRSFPKTFKEFYESLVSLPEFVAIERISSSMPSGGSILIHFILKIEDKFGYFVLSIRMSDTLAFTLMKEDEKKPGYLFRTKASSELFIDEQINLQRYMESFEKELVSRFNESTRCCELNPNMKSFIESVIYVY